MANKMEIISNEIPAQGLLLITILGIIAVVFLSILGVFDIKSFEMFYNCICKYGAELIYCTFFIYVAIRCWVLFFINAIPNPKKEILYLLEKKDGKCKFINKKGKKFFFNDCDKEVNKFYYVLKTHSYICDVFEEYECCIDDWPLKEKDSFWMTLYFPGFSFKDIFLLPILYVIFLPFLLEILIAEGSDKIYGIVFGMIPGSLIIYDLIYKITLRK